MTLQKIKLYRTELINGSKGTISVKEGSDLRYIIQNKKFIKDAFTESFIRSSAIVKFEYVGDDQQ